jgi:hypothetical protein
VKRLQLLRILSPGARLLIHKTVDDDESTLEQLKQVKRKLWLAGYMDVHIGTSDEEHRVF